MRLVAILDPPFVWTIYNFKFVIGDLKNLRVMSFV